MSMQHQMGNGANLVLPGQNQRFGAQSGGYPQSHAQAQAQAQAQQAAQAAQAAALRQQMGRAQMAPQYAPPPSQDWRQQATLAQPTVQPRLGPGSTPAPSAMRVNTAAPPPQMTSAHIGVAAMRPQASTNAAPSRPPFPFAGGNDATPLPNNLSYLNDATEAFPHSSDGDFPTLAGHLGQGVGSQTVAPGSQSVSLYDSGAHMSLHNASFRASTSSPTPGSAMARGVSAPPGFFPQSKAQPSKPYVPGSAPDPYGLLGLLQVLKLQNRDLSTLASGIDLTSLGLNLSSSDVLFSSFASPFSEEPISKDPELQIPSCYIIRPPLPAPNDKMNLFSDETLFYIFYSMPGDSLQIAAAHELQAREWSYHMELKLWFQRLPGTAAINKTPHHEIGSFLYFDIRQWEKKRKQNFRMEYDKLFSSKS